MFAKIWLLSYGKKRHNAGFFKPQYLTKNLRYEIEFLDMIRGPKKHQVFDGYFRWVCSDMPVHAQSDNK